MEACEGNRMVGNEPFGYISMSLFCCWNDFDILEGDYSWSSEMCHRLLIFVAVNCQQSRQGVPLDPQHPFYVYSRKQLDDVLEHEVSKDHPEEVSWLIMLLDSFFDGHD